jgi:peptidoglycan/xylan/chitin deacetylase (PgdA/CDA1 family)
MKFLKENGFQTITLREFAGISATGEDFPAKTVVLTFDDGFQNFRTKAFPVLEDLGFTATVFLVTDFCGKLNDWNGNGPEIPRERLLSWPEVKELAKLGVEFGGHTRTHPDLTVLSACKVADEIAGSRAAIQDALGTDSASFAYPFGKFNSDIKATAGRTFEVACTTRLGKAVPKCDLLSVNRIDAYYLGNQTAIRSISGSNFDRYLAFRQLLRDLRSWAQRN